jgi:hypothetical protein
MTSAQRKLLIGSLTGAAVVIHVVFCEWIKWGGRHYDTILEFGDIHLTVDLTRGGNFIGGVFLGLVLPAALIVLAVYLLMGDRARTPARALDGSSSSDPKG